MGKYFYWGPFFDEKDGGAVVNHYNVSVQHEIRPRDVYYAKCKVPEELNPSVLPFVNFQSIPVDRIPHTMLTFEIPILNIFHIGPQDFDKLIGPVHDVGGKVVLHQTIHWPNDTVMKSETLHDIDYIVAPTDYAKNIFINIAKVPPKNVIVIPHGVDLRKFYRRPTPLREKLGIRKDQKVILYSGRLGFWKGVHQIIPIIRPLVKEFDCVFIIRGGYFSGQKEGEALAKAFTMLSERNPNLIFLPDWMPSGFMEELYAMIDILIFNSAHEGFGVPLIEAQAVGAVPVTTSLANHVEILGSAGFSGLLLAPTEKVGMVNETIELKVAHSDQLYGAVKWLLESPDEMEHIGQRGLENVRARFNLLDIAKVWLNLYDSMEAGESMDELLVKNLGEEKNETFK